MKTIYITEVQRKNLTGLLLENEGTNMKRARKYLESKGYSPEQRQQILDSIRTDIPNSRLQQCKFLLGVTRLYMEGQLNNGNAIANLNKTLKYIASDAHVNEYDFNLNGENLDTLVNRFKGVAKDDLEQSRNASNARQLTINDNYTIVPINSSEEASKYGKYTSWCVTHDKNMYNSYTNNGSGRFYFCLHKGFENEPMVEGEDCPLDNYGLSMIAVSVTMEGEVNTITCRWNHDNGGNDSIMTIEQLEDVIGRNFYQTFKPYTREELHAKGIVLFDEVQELLDSGKKPEEIFDKVGNFRNGFAWVYLNDKFNFINANNQLISDTWFDNCDGFSNGGFACVQLNNKYNLINTNGKLISNTWFDYCGGFHNGVAWVRLNDEYNLINTNGQIISDTWFDRCSIFINGFAIVMLDGKYNLINTNGKLISDTWFDGCGDFDNGVARVVLNNKLNFINTDGKLISNTWFDKIGDFKDGFARVELNDKYNLINTNNQLISDTWFDEIGNFYNGFARVELNDKCNFINTNGQIISDTWFDYCGNFDNGFAIVRLNYKWNFISTNGQLISDIWFDDCYDFRDGVARVELNGQEHYINTNGQIVESKGRKKIKKAIAAQDQVGGKVNAGVMDAVACGGGMRESIENNSLETWYRGYNSKYGSNYTHLLWLTDDIDYARVYGNRIEEITLDMSKISPASLYELDEFCDDYYNGPDEEGSENLMSEGYNCYFFYANNDGSYCMCLWDNTPIMSRRELSKEEYEKIEGYPGYDMKNYDDIYEGVEDDKYELGSENGDISPYYHINESNEEIITLYHGVNREGLEFNLEKGGFVPRVCSEGGPKAVWLSEKQYNYEFTFAFDFPKSLVEQLSNADYIFTNKIGFNDFNCRLAKTSISSFLDNTVVETNILDDRISKLQFRYFPDLGITLWKEFKQYPNILETYINPFIEKYQKLQENIVIAGNPIENEYAYSFNESKEVPKKLQLDESALDFEYHYTTIKNLQSMLSSEEFKLRDSQQDSVTRKKDFFMSLTRVRSCKEGFGLYMNRTQRPLVRIELNGSALNNIRGVNIKSFDYFYNHDKVPARKYGGQRAEAEDSLTTDYKIIPNIFDLINRIDILFGPFYNYQQYKDTYQFLKWITHDNSSYMWLSKIHCYVNENSFNNKKEDEYNIEDLLRDGFFDYVIKKIGFSGMIWRLDDYYSTDNLLIFEEQNLDDVGDCGFDENLFKINLSKLNIKEKTINFSNEKRLISYLSRNGYDGFIDDSYGEISLTLIKNEDYFKNGIIQKFNFNETLYENVESEMVNPEDVDLSSFNIKKNLNPKFWKDGVLDSRIRMKLLDIADDFIEFLGVDWAKPEDITMTGSLANFNWDENYSDIDLHIIMDYSDVDERTEFVSNYFYSQKKLWNEEHSDITIMGFPVEVFVQDINERHDSSGVYSLEKNKWLIEPEREKLVSSKVSKAFIKDKVSEYMNKIDKLEYLLNKSKDDEYRLRRVMEKSNKLFDKIKGERKIGFERSGGKEINNYNIVFKALKRNGYLEKLYNLKCASYNKYKSTT